MNIRKCVDPYLLLSVVALTVVQFVLSWIILRSACLIFYNETACEIILHEANDTYYQKEEQLIQYTASKWNLIGNGVYGVLSTIGANFYGNLEDTKGRKFTLVFLSVGNVASLLICLSLPFLKHSPLNSLYIVTFYQFVSGLFGGIPVILNMSIGYLRHVLDAENITIRFGILEASFFIGIFIGPMITGFAVDNIGLLYTILIAVATMLLSLLYSILVLENDSTSRKRCNYIQILNPLATLKNIKDVVSDNKIQTRSALHKLLLCALLGSLAFAGTVSLLYLFLRKAPISFTNSEMGVYSGIQHLIQGCGLLLIMPLLLKILKLNDLYVAMIGALSKMCFLLLLAFGRKRWLMYTALAFAIGSFDTPALRSAILKQVEKSESGRILGILSSFYSIGFLCSQLVLQPIYMATIKFFPGLAFVLCAICYLIEVVLLLKVCYKIDKCVANEAVPMDQQDGVRKPNSF